MTVTLADLPVPSGQDAVAEAGLLAQALMAASPPYAEARFAARQDDPGTAGDGVLHLILSRDGQVMQDFYLEKRADGGGRYHADVPAEERAGTVDVHVDVGDQLTARLRQLSAILAATADERYVRPVTNAAEAAEATLSGAGTDPALAAAGNDLVQACLAGAGAGAADALVTAARDSVRDATQQHLTWRMDGWSLAAILIATNVPIACAATADRSALDTATFARYLGTAASAARSGDWQQVGIVISRALADGHAGNLAVLGADLSAEAIRLRDEALAGPPSPMIFGQKLFEALPYVLAAWWISRWADDGGAPPPGPEPDTWKKRRTDAEELYVRMTDGVFAQWWRYVTGAVAQERRDIMAVARDKGKLAANELLRKGEDSYDRPKSLRPYLLGEHETPDGS
jgi:hypothetical protein